MKPYDLTPAAREENSRRAALAKPNERESALQHLSEKSVWIKLLVSEDGGYTIHAPDIPGCVSEGETLPETVRNFAEALEAHSEPLDPEPSNRPYQVRDALRFGGTIYEYGVIRWPDAAFALIGDLHDAEIACEWLNRGWWGQDQFEWMERQASGMKP